LERKFVTNTGYGIMWLHWPNWGVVEKIKLQFLSGGKSFGGKAFKNRRIG